MCQNTKLNKYIESLKNSLKDTEKLKDDLKITLEEGGLMVSTPIPIPSYLTSFSPLKYEVFKYLFKVTSQQYNVKENLSMFMNNKMFSDRQLVIYGPSYLKKMKIIPKPSSGYNFEILNLEHFKQVIINQIQSDIRYRLNWVDENIIKINNILDSVEDVVICNYDDILDMKIENSGFKISVPQGLPAKNAYIVSKGDDKYYWTF